jgi:hypothetical protein
MGYSVLVKLIKEYDFFNPQGILYTSQFRKDCINIQYIEVKMRDKKLVKLFFHSHVIDHKIAQYTHSEYKSTFVNVEIWGMV